MLIGIHASALFKKNKTGVEEYAYQLIKNLAKLKDAQKHRFILYINKKPDDARLKSLNLPSNFQVKVLRAPFFWTQIRLSLEMIFHRPDVLFSPAQVFPLILPAQSVLTVHGLEYEFFPKTYSFFRRNYLRYLTRRSSRRASKIITPSENTKEDLIRIYRTKRDKIFVVHHGFTTRPKSDFSEVQPPNIEKSIIFSREARYSEKETVPTPKSTREPRQVEVEPTYRQADENEKFYKLQATSYKLANYPYILYIGRIELKKNLEKAIRAFNLAKSKFHIPHKFILAGGPGFGAGKIKKTIKSSFFGKDIILTGFVSEEEKTELYKNADLLLFVSLYEGFGIPILEAQSFDVPVVTSRISSIPEVAGNGALFVYPHDVDLIAAAIFRALENNDLRKTLIQNGRKNLEKFSWQKCAAETLEVLDPDT